MIISSNYKQPLRFIDLCCGSGRMLLAGAQFSGKQHHFYGIDLDITCVKMAAINLFLNGIFHCEIMCANALSPDDFRISYKLSFLPFGIFRIENKEQSELWHLYKNSFERKPKVGNPDITLPSEDGIQFGNGSQLHLF
jgi:type I restriction-modification system DNA methylase subunit